MNYLTDREMKIWDQALNHYRGDRSMFNAIAQTSDLAKDQFAEMMMDCRDRPGYDQSIDREGLIYAKYLLTTYAIQWAKKGFTN